MEGRNGASSYTNLSMPSSPTSTSPHPVDYNIFKSSSEAFQEAVRDFRASGYTMDTSDPRTLSSRKRRFEGDGGAAEIRSVDEDIVLDLGVQMQCRQKKLANRPVRPLKRTFGKTQSAPAGALRFSQPSYWDYETLDVDAFMDAF